MRKHLKLSATVLGLIIGLAAPQAHAFYSTMDTGDVLPEGKYSIGAETQFITNNDSGANLVTRFDGGISEEAGFRGELGFGTTDLHLGAFFKWIPIPDYDQQPAIGITSGLVFAEYSGHSEVSLRFHPIISKGFATEFGKITPYGSLPFGLRSYNDDTDVPVQMTLGSELFFSQIPLWRFKGEVGFDLNDAFTYISIGASLDFDAENGIRFN